MEYTDRDSSLLREIKSAKDNGNYGLTKKLRAQLRRNRAARSIRECYADLGMKRVRGNLGGVYYE